MVKMYHSVNMCYADNKVGSLERDPIKFVDILHKRSIEALEDKLLCLSDRALWNVGLVLEARLERVFAYDVDSSWNEDGSREVAWHVYEDDGSCYGECIGVDLDSPDDVYRWIEEEAPRFREAVIFLDSAFYVEAWGRAVRLEAVYVEPNIEDGEVLSPKLREIGEALANKLGVPLVVADRYVPIYKA